MPFRAVKEWTREWMEEGLQKGLEKGMQEGLEKAYRKEKRKQTIWAACEVLSQLIELKFATVPSKMKSSVKPRRGPTDALVRANSLC